MREVAHSCIRFRLAVADDYQLSERITDARVSLSMARLNRCCVAVNTPDCHLKMA